jgi:hypothetical protein
MTVDDGFGSIPLVQVFKQRTFAPPFGGCRRPRPLGPLRRIGGSVYGVVVGPLCPRDRPFPTCEFLPANFRSWPVRDARCAERNVRNPGGAAVHRRQATDRTRPYAAGRTSQEQPFNESSYPATGADWCDRRNHPGSIHHWITSSARSSSDCGIVRPSNLAVRRLMVSSSLLGNSIGRSLGFAPRRTLSTYDAAR